MDRIGKYEIVKELGTGATSTVNLALDSFNNQQVALKLFNLDLLRDPDRAKASRKLLLTEASLAGKLSHPHIVKVIDAVVEGELNYVVMEYVEGETLERHSEVENLLPMSTAAARIIPPIAAVERCTYRSRYEHAGLEVASARR